MEQLGNIDLWWSATGKPEDEDSKKATFALNLKADGHVFYRTPEFSFRGTFYFGSWSKDNGVVTIKFTGKNNLQTRGYCDDVAVVELSGKKARVVFAAATAKKSNSSWMSAS